MLVFTLAEDVTPRWEHGSMTRRAARFNGRMFRYRLTLLLRDARRPLTVAEIVADLEGLGVEIRGRPGKTVSDALRWEIGKGRVRRVAPSTYAFVAMPASTGRWMHAQLLRAHH
jgi:hypothetical protein